MPQANIFSSFKNLTNALAPAQIGKQSEIWGSARHDDNYAAVYNGVVCMGMNPVASPVTLSAALATTYVGLCLSNPAGSGKNLNLLTVETALIVAPAALTSLFLITGYATGGITAHTTPLTPQSAFVGLTPNGSIVGLLDSACTLVGTPVGSRVLGTTTGATTPYSTFQDLKGSILIPPGGYVAIGSNIAGPTSGFLGSFSWEEVPV